MTTNNTATDYLAITEHQISPLPDQDHLPFWEKEWIAPELKNLLFGQMEAEDDTNSILLRTYLIVDAYLYTKIRGFFDLDLIDEIPVKCLFQGKAGEQLKAVAPYLIDLTLSEIAWDDKDKISDFHKYYFDKQWHQGTGIFVRSTIGIEGIYQHFRKFTQLQDEHGKWYFFRFWEPKIFRDYMNDLSHQEGKIMKWFGGNAREITMIAIITGILHSYVLAQDISANKPPGSIQLEQTALARQNARRVMADFARKQNIPFDWAVYEAYGYPYQDFFEEDLKILVLLHGHFEVKDKYNHQLYPETISDPVKFSDHDLMLMKRERIRKYLFFKAQGVPYGL